MRFRVASRSTTSEYRAPRSTGQAAGITKQVDFDSLRPMTTGDRNARPLVSVLQHKGSSDAYLLTTVRDI